MKFEWEANILFKGISDRDHCMRILDSYLKKRDFLFRIEKTINERDTNEWLDENLYKQWAIVYDSSPEIFEYYLQDEEDLIKFVFKYGSGRITDL